jgi:hypothetical protein
LPRLDFGSAEVGFMKPQTWKEQQFVTIDSKTVERSAWFVLNCDSIEALNIGTVGRQNVSERYHDRHSIVKFTDLPLQRSTKDLRSQPVLGRVWYSDRFFQHI